MTFAVTRRVLWHEVITRESNWGGGAGRPEVKFRLGFLWVALLETGLSQLRQLTDWSDL